MTGERPFLRRNKTDGSYNDAEHYLDVQFRLLREDFVRPLREGIAKLLERIGSAKIGAFQDIRVYKDVRLLYPVCTTDGLRYRIKFDNTRLRNVRWENSKRLIFGSLMCLSKDKFESFVFATIANRDAKELKQVLKHASFFHKVLILAFCLISTLIIKNHLEDHVIFETLVCLPSEEYTLIAST